MRRKFAIATAAACAAMVCAVPALAKEKAPGVPGTPNCHGQTIAWLAQLNKGSDLPKGLAGYARTSTATGRPLTVQEVQKLVADYCAGLTPGP